MAKRILLAEPNRQLATTLVARLAPLGFTVQHEVDGVSALAALAAEQPDLLLLELKLPGLHGIELLKKLRRSPRTAELPVVVVTGFYKGERYQAAARDLGVRHYLEKPFKSTELVTIINRVLGPGQKAAQSLEPRPFSHHLRTAFLKHFTGMLSLTDPDAVRLLTFINGAPVALRPGYESHDLGDFLCKRGQITAAEYDYFKTSAAYRHDSLVQIGCLRYGDLLQAEMDYLNQELVCAFGSGPCQASWETVPAPDLLQLITLNVPQLFYEGFHKHPGTAVSRLLKTFRDKFILLDKDYYRHINFLRLNETEKRFLHQIDGRHRLVDLLDSHRECGPLALTLTNLNMVRFAHEPTPSAAPEDLPLRTLFNIVIDDGDAGEDVLESFSDLLEDAGDDRTIAAGAVETLSPTAAGAAPSSDLTLEVRLIAKSLEEKNHYEVFGIKQSKFSITLLKERYFAITRKFGPEVLIQLGGEEAALVEEILSRVATAYDTLSDVVKKERYDEMLGTDKIGLGQQGDDRFQAQVLAESGKVFLGMADWDSAEKALQEAANADANNGDYLACLAWAIYRNPRYADSQAMQNKARQMLNKALGMERTAQGFAYKGWMLLETGQESMAEAEFNKALKLDARQTMARNGLRTLQEHREKQKKGLFKRMFK